MFLKTWFWIKRIYKRLRSIFTLSRSNPSISDAQVSIDIINDKIKLLKGTSDNSINIFAYEKYFAFLERLELKEEFTLLTTKDNLILSGSVIQPILLNNNNKKILIFCHGLTNNRWSLFYIMHLALQRGYQVVTYDSRGHGVSGKSPVSLGQNEACDLQDVIEWVKKKYRPEKIGIYGFSMGAATLIFWISFFGTMVNSGVSFAICEAPFDYFDKQWKKALGSGINYYWKKIFATKLIRESLKTSRKNLEKINPYLSLPQQLPIKLLLIHGLEDVIINWRASFNLWYQLRKDKLNAF